MAAEEINPRLRLVVVWLCRRVLLVYTKAA